MPMVNHSPQLGLGQHQDNGGDGLQEQDDFGAKVLGAINASQLRAVGTRQCTGSPTHAHGQAVPEEEEKQQRQLGPTVSERERLETGAHCWAEPNPTHPHHTHTVGCEMNGWAEIQRGLLDARSNG